MERTIHCGGKDLLFTVKRSHRRRTVALRVEPSGALTIYAPSFVWGPFIDRFVQKQTSWILKKLAYFQDRRAAQTPLPPKEWCKQHTEGRLREPLSRHAHQMNVTPLSIHVGHQAARWGSCSSRGRLRFSSRMATLPQDVFEYIVVHELAHLKVLDHSRQFWAVVETECRAYKAHRKWLRENSWKSSWPEESAS